MIEFTESQLTVRFEDDNLNETNCFKVEDKLENSWPLKDMDFFYSKQQCFYFVEVSEFAQKSRKEIKQYRKEQGQEIIRKALDSLLLAFSHQYNFTIDNNFIHSQPKQVCLYFIYYVDASLDDDSKAAISTMYDNVQPIIANYQKITGLPFVISVANQQLAKEKLNVFLNLKHG